MDHIEELPHDHSGPGASDDGLVNEDLYIACMEERIGDVEKLLIKVTAINRGFGEGDTPLHAACKRKNQQLVQMLIAHGADVKVTNWWKQTPLHIVCDFFWGRDRTIGECINIVKLLIKSGADVNATMITGRTPLHTACREGLIDVAELLIRNGADVNIKTPGPEFGSAGQTPLHECSRRHAEPEFCAVSLASLLINHGADINSRDNLKQTPLHIACYHSNEYSDNIRYYEFIEYLLGNGADVNAVDDFGGTPLYIACSHDHEKRVEVLLDHGASANGTESCNPLEKACNFGCIKIAEMLLRRGADAFQTNIYGFVSKVTQVDDMNGNSCEILKMLLQSTLNFSFESLLQQILSCRSDDVRTSLRALILGYHTPATSVGSLKELCRDKVRNLLKESCHNTRSFVVAVDSLQVPTTVKDIIFLRRCVNNV